ncbi:MAG: NUDIX domain-containing protein [Candidatus Omnitrophota bacterium]|jgi:ADP-ribose pyrophosphatase YjhB (NUDIX family)
MDDRMKIIGCDVRVLGRAVSSRDRGMVVKKALRSTSPDMEMRIRRTCSSSLKKAARLKARSVTFSALGCDDGEFPLLASAKIMAQEVLKALRSGNTSLKKVTFCPGGKIEARIFDKGVIGYLNHFTEELESRPFTTVDAIIEVRGGIVVIKRSNPPFGWALPGGFVDHGESLEEAVMREAKEETGLKLSRIKQFHTYSDPGRDPRFHTIGTVFIASAKGIPRAGDDAAELKVVRPAELKKIRLAFDHKRIVEDYLKYKKGIGPF